MPDELDPLDWLKAHDPIRDADTSPTDAERDAVLERVRRRLSDRRRRSRRLIPVAAAAAVLAATGGVAAAHLLGRARSPIPADVVCFAEVDLDANRVVLDRGTDPLMSCTAAWSDPQYTEVFGARTPPSLALCRLPTGVEAALPGDAGDPCEELGLETVVGERPVVDMAVVRLEDLLSTSMAQGCISFEAAAKLADDAIDEVGLSTWGVDSIHASDHACASVSIDTDAELVRLVPLPTSTQPSD